LSFVAGDFSNRFVFGLENRPKILPDARATFLRVLNMKLVAPPSVLRESEVIEGSPDGKTG
jgi:hypothetical protein